MGFDDKGRVFSYGLKDREVETWINSGRPFMTSGCPGGEMESACNRPYGDGPPRDIRSFPFPLGREDILLVKNQLNRKTSLQANH